MVKHWLAAGAAALSLGVTATASYAQTTTVPGEQVGLAVGAPLPEGVYAIDTFSWRRADGPNSPNVGVNIPVLVWSTPWKVFDSRIELVTAAPTLFVGTRNPAPIPNRDISWNVGTFVGSIFAWDLGNNVGFSYLFGAYLNDLNGDRGSLVGAGGGPFVLPQLASTTYRQGFALSYTGDGWNLTANLTHNFYLDPVGRFNGPVGSAIGSVFIADGLNLDLTATKKFGKFEIGAIGYGTVDLPASTRDLLRTVNGPAYTKGGRFAVGGLLGYDFGPFTAQVYVARDVATTALDANGRKNYQTDGWFRLVAPLYTVAAAAPPPSAPIIRKY
ncbi:hypothetical protein OPKNFCMD_5950 [Methylobacterium crusticola]|uniref:Transporter n=1 Tax=Methylobacterium crusticola TaxID=1697972 RepID=A0ABQ4R8Q6_9HYPH|nr:transporter [Methylobacterium crusticola]GJD53179.1 hypothetical protein OPKNFCMD_5950 [Methylobacterium crusticola]